MEQHPYSSIDKEAKLCECGEPLLSECHREWLNAQNDAGRAGPYRKWYRVAIVAGRSVWASEAR